MLVLCMSSILQLLLYHLAIGMKMCSPKHSSSMLWRDDERKGRGL